MFFLCFCGFFLIRLQRSGAEHVYACGDDRDGDDNSRKAEEDIGQDTADKGRQDPVQDICDIVPENGGSEQDQKDCKDGAVFFERAVRAADELIQMEDIGILHGIEVLLRERLQIVYIEETVEPENGKEQHDPPHVYDRRQGKGSPEEQHDADALFPESHIHLSGAGDQRRDKY